MSRRCQLSRDWYDIMYIMAQMDELRRRMGVVYPMD